MDPYNIFNYWKVNENLVCAKYAAKALKMLVEEFKQWAFDNSINTVQKKAPSKTYQIVLYDWGQIFSYKQEKIRKKYGHGETKVLQDKEFFQYKRNKEWEIDIELWSNLSNIEKRNICLERKSFRVKFTKNKTRYSKNFKRLQMALHYRDANISD